MGKQEEEKNKAKASEAGNCQDVFVVRRKSSGIKRKEKKKEEVEPRMFSFSSLLHSVLEEDLRREKEDPEKVVRISQERKKRKK